MIPGTCIAIETKKFPILEGEEDELVNDNMYGKALCLYLKDRLPTKGVEVPTFLCEDWGWWIEIKDGDFTMGLCIYSDPEAEKDPEKYAIMSSISDKKWSWSKFKRIDLSENVLKVMGTVENIFKEDKEIESVSRHDGYPF